MVGCSKDTLEELQAFARKHDFRFPLVADPEAEILKAYGAFKPDWGVSGRVTAVIDVDGRVLKTYPDAPIAGKGHAKQVLDDVRALVG